MNGPIKQTDWLYRTLLIIWIALFSSHFGFLFALYVINPDIFQLDCSQPFIGDHYVIVPLALLFIVEELIISFWRHSSYLKRSISEQNPELVQTALITSLANAACISLCGLFLGLIFSYTYFYIWLLVGLLASVYYFPRRSDLKKSRIG